VKPGSRHAPGPVSGLATEDGRLVLAGISYLNSRPIQDALEGPPYRGRFHLDRMVPSEAARRVAEGEAALGLIPVAAAATHGGLRFVRGIAIGSHGPVRSVLVVSRKPIDGVSTVLLDASSRTSVVLARLVLGRLRRSEPRWALCQVPLRLEKLPDDAAAVIIGDPALAVRESFPHVIDLGQAWFEWTGEPFVFAGWAGDPAVLAGVGFTRRDEELLRSGLAAGLDMRRAIARCCGFDETAAYSYLTEAVRYTFDEPERRGLALFYDKAADEGLLPRAEPLFFDDPAPKAKRSLDTLLQRAADGERVSGADAVRIGTEASLFDLGMAADSVRRRKHPDGVVTYIIDRNVNYTNVCTTSCRFCAFYRPVGHPEGYVLSKDQLAIKLREVCEAGGVQILLQGGLNPDLPLAWYEDLFRWIKAEFRLGLHALSPEEIWHIARLERLPVEEVLTRLSLAGLDSVPGGGAEILVDRVRRHIAKAKCTSDEWLYVMRACHHMGLRSSATMMYGTIDTAHDRVLHLLKVRDLQDETHGFTAFFCWDYRHEQGTRLAPGDNGTPLYLRTQALARLVLDNVAHVGASWVTQGPDVGEIALRFGADDFGSVMIEENVVSSAGTTYRIDAGGIERRIHAAGFRAVRRNVLYDWLTPPG
jgi:cyclic dehypoxanthinyl futalosine synthase